MFIAHCSLFVVFVCCLCLLSLFVVFVCSSLIWCVVVIEFDPIYNCQVATDAGVQYKQWEQADYSRVSKAITHVYKRNFPTLVVKYWFIQLCSVTPLSRAFLWQNLRLKLIFPASNRLSLSRKVPNVLTSPRVVDAMQQGGDLSRSYAGSFIPTFTHALVAQYDAKRAVFYAPYVALSYLFHFVFCYCLTVRAVVL